MCEHPISNASNFFQGLPHKYRVRFKPVLQRRSLPRLKQTIKPQARMDENGDLGFRNIFQVIVVASHQTSKSSWTCHLRGNPPNQSGRLAGLFPVSFSRS